MRYGHRKIDMIITMYPEALEFVLKDCRDILPDVPILALNLQQGFEVPKTDRPIIGHFTGRCSSHADTARLMRQIYADPSCWEMVDLWQEPSVPSWIEQTGMVALVAGVRKTRRAAAIR